MAEDIHSYCLFQLSVAKPDFFSPTTLNKLVLHLCYSRVSLCTFDTECCFHCSLYFISVANSSSDISLSAEAFEMWSLMVLSFFSSVFVSHLAWKLSLPYLPAMLATTHPSAVNSTANTTGVTVDNRPTPALPISRLVMTKAIYPINSIPASSVFVQSNPCVSPSYYLSLKLIRVLDSEGLCGHAI